MDIPEAPAEQLPLEPDYRFTLANERTFLAWERTSLGLLATAVAVVHFMPDLVIEGGGQILGVLIGALAVLTAVAGLARWVQIDRAMRYDRPLPRFHVPIYLTAGLVITGLVTLGLALTAAIR